MTSVPVPGESHPTGQESMGTTGVHLEVELGAPRGGWALGGVGWGPFGSCRVPGGSLWPVAHLEVLEELGRQVAAHARHGVHPWQDTRAISPRVGTTGPQRTCLGTRRAYLALLDPSQDPSSAPDLERPILTPVISA